MYGYPDCGALPGGEWLIERGAPGEAEEPREAGEEARKGGKDKQPGLPVHDGAVA